MTEFKLLTISKNNVDLSVLMFLNVLDGLVKFVCVSYYVTSTRLSIKL